MKNQFCNLGCLIAISLASLFGGCSTSTPSVAKQASDSAPKAAPVNASADGYFLPKGTFKGPDQAKPMVLASTVLASEGSTRKIVGQAVGLSPMVWLYSSPTSKSFYDSSSIDFKANLRMWEVFLKKYQIPFKTLTTVEQLETSASGVLILPSLVALSDREKRAIVKFSGLGGSLLASWLTGVRDEKGNWQGFSFMRDTLGVQVLGDTENDETENFLVTYGDGVVTHSLPAGQRMWLERVEGVYPLRLAGQQAAAQIMDWSRTTVRGKHMEAIVFGEQQQASGTLSRSVVLGYGERLWRSADPKVMEAIAHNALTWLFRQPDAYLAAWPAPYSGALSIAVDSPDIVDEVDVKFARWIEAYGRATYYILTTNAEKSAPSLKILQSRGHEIGLMADHFEGFQGQPRNTQSKRLATMQSDLLAAGLSTGSALGLHAPVESQDKVTLDLINQQGFTHVVLPKETSDGRLPITVTRSKDASGTQNPLVILPRTQIGPEDMMGEGDPEDGLKQYLAEFETSVTMGGLALVSFPNQTLLTEDQIKVIFTQIQRHSDKLWVAPNGAVARWWLDRERIGVEINAIDGRPALTVVVSAGTPLTQAATVIVNLPYANDALKLAPLDQNKSEIKVHSLDPWRTAVSIDALLPGTYRWVLQFERAGTQSQR
jgi:hypothetical protein